MASRLFRLQPDEGQSRLRALIDQLNADPDVHGILVQLPLPSNFDSEAILDAVHPLKDVDAFHPENVGRIMQGRPRMLPCTPHGVLQILFHSGIQTSGRYVVVVGRSDIVGKPMAMLLAQRTSPFGPEWANATVTICHSRTPNLSDYTQRADVLIVAVGQPHVITAEMIKPGAAVIDVGMNRTETGLVGDVDFEKARHVAGYLTPVPGGVGPLTIAMLLHNTLVAAELQTKQH
jgi:methylenetetrahydrofolate dehydrogenase (NADP+)/methenyltetrahydrofolate cyclohydrolase